MDQQFNELPLLNAGGLPLHHSVTGLSGSDDASCLVFEAQSENVLVPEIFYKGTHSLVATHPNFLSNSNPGLLFPKTMPGHDIFLSRLLDAFCLDGGLIITKNGRIFSESFRHISRTHHRVGLQPLSEELFRPTSVPASFRRLSGKCLFLDGEHFAGYGHFLGEVLTRLWICKFINISSFKIICGRVEAGFLLPLLQPFGIQREQVIFNDGGLICEELWVPSQSFIVRQSTTPQARATWRVIGDHYDLHDAPERVYISRSRARSRPLVNEREVEELFRSYGFTIAYPELMSVAEQVNLFRNTKWLSGCSGSGLFNCAFSGLEQKKLFLTSRNYLLHTDVLLNSTSNHTIAYLVGEPHNEQNVHSPWHVDLAELKDAVENYL